MAGPACERSKLRLWGRRQRQRLTFCARQEASQSACHHFQKMWETLGPTMRPACVGLYTPLTTEVDIAPLAEWLTGRGVDVVFPHITRPESPLTFARTPSEASLKNLVCSFTSKDWILVPGLAFDCQGARLGFGKGYYDRTLATTPARRIGVFFEAQYHAHLPTLAHDVFMDGLLTERGFRWVHRAPLLRGRT